MKIFKLPDLGEGLADAKILQWHVKEQEHVKADDPLVSVETAKSVIEIPSPETGIIKKTYGTVGDNIQVNANLVMFEGLAKTAIKAMPAARKLAKEYNIDLADVETTNSTTLTVNDVKNHLANSRNNRTAMAYNMQQAYKNVVPATIHEDINLRLWQEKEDIIARVIQAIFYAMEKHPRVNSTFCNKKNELIACKERNIGLAVQKESGLYVPNIKATKDIRSQIDAIKLKDELKPNSTSPSIIYSNIGSIAGRYSNPILVPPAVIIIATGKIRKEVTVVADKATICPIMPISITFDHRALTGAEVAVFIRYFEKDLVLKTSIIQQVVTL